MRLLKRGLKPFEYRAYAGKEEILTETMQHTGTYQTKYADPVQYMGSFSEARGYASQKVFGRNANYTHVLLVDDTTAEITENGLVDFGENTYTVTAVVTSANYLSVALRLKTKNTVSEAELDAIKDNLLHA